MELDATGRMLIAAVEITQLLLAVYVNVLHGVRWGRPTYLGDGAHPPLSRCRRKTQT